MIVTAPAFDGILKVTVLVVPIADSSGKYARPYEKLAKGDIVLYYYSEDSKVMHLEKCESIEGVAASRNSDKELSVNGKAYPATALTGGNYNVTAADGWDDWTGTYTFYLDNSGAIVYTAVVKAGESTDYAFVAATGWNTTTSISASNYAEAKLVFPDASSKVVHVSKINGTSATAGNYADVADKWVTYSTDSDGNYVLKIATTAVAATAKVTGGQGAFVAGYKGSENTKFVVETTDAGGTASSTAYAGIKALPSIATSAGLPDSYIVTASGVATYVYIKAGARDQTGANTDWFLVTGKTYATVGKSGDVPTHYDVEGVKNGEKTTVSFASLPTGNLAQGTLYKLTTYEKNGFVSKVQGDNVIAVDSAGIKISGNVLGSGQAVNASTFTFKIKLGNGGYATVSVPNGTAGADNAAYSVEAIGSSARKASVTGAATSGNSDVAVTILGKLSTLGTKTIALASSAESGSVVTIDTTEKAVEAGANKTATFAYSVASEDSSSQSGTITVTYSADAGYVGTMPTTESGANTFAGNYATMADGLYTGYSGANTNHWPTDSVATGENGIAAKTISVFKFTMAGSAYDNLNQDYVLTIKNAAGVTLYEETKTQAKLAGASGDTMGGYFYLKTTAITGNYGSDGDTVKYMKGHASGSAGALELTVSSGTLETDAANIYDADGTTKLWNAKVGNFGYFRQRYLSASSIRRKVPTSA